MKNFRTLFYVVLTLMVLATGGLLYWLFSPKPSEKVSENWNFNAPVRSPSPAPGPKITEPEVKGPLAPTLPDTGDLKLDAEIEKNLKNLVTLFEQGRLDEFKKDLDLLLAKYPDVKEYVALAGDYYFRQGDWPNAEKAVRKLLALDPQNTYAQTSLGEIEAAEGKFADSMKLHEQVLAKDPGNIPALSGLMSAADLKGDTSQAEEKIKALYLAHSDNGNLAVFYGELLRQKGKEKEAEEVLAKAKATTPNNPLVLQNAALEAEDKGDLDSAISLVQSSIAHDQEPESRTASYELLFDLAIQKKNFTLAKEVATQIKMDNPDPEMSKDLDQRIEEAQRGK